MTKKYQKLLITLVCPLPIVFIKKAIADALAKFESIEFLSIDDVEEPSMEEVEHL